MYRIVCPVLWYNNITDNSTFDAVQQELEHSKLHSKRLNNHLQPRFFFFSQKWSPFDDHRSFVVYPFVKRDRFPSPRGAEIINTSLASSLTCYCPLYYVVVQLIWAHKITLLAHFCRKFDGFIKIIYESLIQKNARRATWW